MAKPAFCRVPGCGREWPRDPVLEVACPDCHAPIGAWCRRPSGHRAMRPHAARDLAADRLGCYGACPFGRCDAAPPAVDVVELDDGTIADQLVIPGCEKGEAPAGADRAELELRAHGKSRARVDQAGVADLPLFGTRELF